MNEIPRVPKARPTTQVADGVPRLRWTLAEFERLTELGFFTEDDRIEPSLPLRLADLGLG